MFKNFPPPFFQAHTAPISYYLLRGNPDNIFVVVDLNLSEPAQDGLSKKKRSLVIRYNRGLYILKIYSCERNLLEVDHSTDRDVSVSIYKRRFANNILG